MLRCPKTKGKTQKLPLQYHFVIYHQITDPRYYITFTFSLTINVLFVLFAQIDNSLYSKNAKKLSLADLELEFYLQGRLMAAFEEEAGSQAEMFSNCASQCVRPSPFKSDPFTSHFPTFLDKRKLARSTRV